MQSPSEFGFELLSSMKVGDLIPISKYKSKATGLIIYLADIEGPVVHGHFCLATEAQDDDGLPHTLEHLVFMGSEEYPYKGTLDLLAQRCLSSGTNAWTAIDHTCYTIVTAGSQGFLNLLPIYLDHILYPTLTESAYITEVHHVNGEGEDAGVVYCEMQATENTGDSRIFRSLMKTMYPKNCSCRWEIGGIMENLRTSTSHRKVCDYHKAFYHSKNFALIITGKIQDVFKEVATFEKKILEKGHIQTIEFKKPWQDAMPLINKDVDLAVQYPCSEEEHGIYECAWSGPHISNVLERSAIVILMAYLTETAVAPLQRDFVEIPDPYSSKIYFSLLKYPETCIYLGFANVPKEKLTLIKERLKSVLLKISIGQEEIDMKRIQIAINRRILDFLSELEESPHHFIVNLLILDFLHCTEERGSIDTFVDLIKYYTELKKMPSSFWVELLTKYLINGKMISAIAEPSIKLSDEMSQAEKNRIAEHQKKLGVDGLKEKEERLQKAIDDNGDPPDELINSIAVPDLSSIQFHLIKVSHNQDSMSANENEKFPLKDLPLQFRLDDIHSNFVQMFALMNTSHISQELRMYLPLFLEVIFQSPILRNRTLISHEDVINEIASDTLMAHGTLGVGGSRFFSGSFGQLAVINIRVELAKYQKGINWLKEILYFTQFTVERLKIIANKMINDVSELKRDGHVVVLTILRNLNFLKESNHYCTSMLRQQSFLNKMLKALDESPSQILEAMENLRHLLTNPCNLSIHLSADVEKLAAYGPPHFPWQNNFLPNNLKDQVPRCALQVCHELRYQQSEGPGTGFIVGLGSEESSYLMQSSKSITSITDPDLPALMLAMQYFTLSEGPLWKQIRGLGLSYHFSIHKTTTEGLIYFELAQSTHLVNAYKAAKEIMNNYLNNGEEWSEVDLEASKSSLIFVIINKENTAMETSMQSMINSLHGVDITFNKLLLDKVWKLTIPDLQRIGRQYLLPLFDPCQSKCAISCHLSKVNEIKAGFLELGRELEILPSVETNFLSEIM